MLLLSLSIIYITQIFHKYNYNLHSCVCMHEIMFLSRFIWFIPSEDCVSD